MKKDKQWEKPQADVMKRKSTKKTAGSSKSRDARFGLGPLAPPTPPYRTDFV
jgi:hypothetical protein